MAAPNLVAVTSIFGKTTATTLTSVAQTDILTCASNKLLKINTIIISNIDSDNNDADVTVNFRDDSQNTYFSIAETVTVPNDSVLVVIGKDSPIYLEEGDKIQAHASATGDLQIVISYEELDDAWLLLTKL